MNDYVLKDLNQSTWVRYNINKASSYEDSHVQQFPEFENNRTYMDIKMHGFDVMLQSLELIIRDADDFQHLEIIFNFGGKIGTKFKLLDHVLLGANVSYKDNKFHVSISDWLCNSNYLVLYTGFYHCHLGIRIQTSKVELLKNSNYSICITDRFIHKEIESIEKLIFQYTYKNINHSDTKGGINNQIIIDLSKPTFKLPVHYLFLYVDDYEDVVSNIELFLNGVQAPFKHKMFKLRDNAEMIYEDHERSLVIQKALQNLVLKDIIKYGIIPYTLNDRLDMYRDKTIYEISSCVDDSESGLFDFAMKKVFLMNNYEDSIHLHIHLKEGISQTQKRVFHIGGICRNLLEQRHSSSTVKYES
jgi:hypothetical protein